jgi:hypothetical protein
MGDLLFLDSPGSWDALDDWEAQIRQEVLCDLEDEVALYHSSKWIDDYWEPLVEDDFYQFLEDGAPKRAPHRPNCSVRRLRIRDGIRFGRFPKRGAKKPKYKNVRRGGEYHRKHERHVYA